MVVSGSCDIREDSFLRVNAKLVNDITLGADCWIGHVVLSKNVEGGSMYRPARSDRREESTLEFFELSRMADADTHARAKSDSII